ncbi:hypothetical protein Lalb_Chr24g0402931 [Lupinus albus]|uniref:Uncharacterized protein n=1 Tax=Lupinus albus TaxID=3870 RepID=A0A6A4NIN2_LUPAL|nr:hypothetical protein Lalb_Chr24g0402931 [Lupinus albus]
MVVVEFWFWRVKAKVEDDGNFVYVMDEDNQELRMWGKVKRKKMQRR